MINFVGCTYKSMNFLSAMKLKCVLFAIAILLPTCLFAQEGMPSDEEIEKMMFESIEKEINKYNDLLKLEEWQIFYVDSILTHNYDEMRKEQMRLSKGGVSTADAYQRSIDNCAEKNYQAFKLVFNEEQWARYLKVGAEKEKKLRDKRKAKREAKGIY